jgi:hypothetical protein
MYPGSDTLYRVQRKAENVTLRRRLLLWREIHAMRSSNLFILLIPHHSACRACPMKYEVYFIGVEFREANLPKLGFHWGPHHSVLSPPHSPPPAVAIKHPPPVDDGFPLLPGL